MDKRSKGRLFHSLLIARFLLDDKTMKHADRPCFSSVWMPQLSKFQILGTVAR